MRSARRNGTPNQSSGIHELRWAPVSRILSVVTPATQLLRPALPSGERLIAKHSIRRVVAHTALALLTLSLASTAGAADFVSALTRSDTHDATPGDGICADANGACTLRAAIEEANALPGRDSVRIVVASTSAGLLLTQVAVTDDLDLIGQDLASTHVDGVRTDRLLDVAAGVSLRITDLALGQGLAPEGGLIRNAGSLEIERVVLASGTSLRGGAIYNSGTLSVVDAVFVRDVGQAVGGLGGGIYNIGSATLDRVTFHKGQALFGCGGGVYIGSGGTLSALNTTFFKNGARHGRGAAVCNEGGAFFCSNCTIARNRATSAGGGILNVGGSVDLRNTILAGNTVTLSGTGNCNGAIHSLGHNLDDDGSCGLASGGDLTGVDPLLRGLILLDGPIPVAVFKSNRSPAIDAGDETSCPAVDARGADRPMGSNCDIGAFENSEPAATPPATSTPTTSPTETRTFTESPTPSETPTPVTGTPTPSRTETPSPTETNTPAPTASPTETATPSETPTPVPTRTPTSSPSPTTTPTPLPPGLFLVDLTAGDSPDLLPGDGLCADAGGRCSIRAAIEEANASTSHDTIRLPAGYVRVNSQLTITGDVEIIGGGMRNTQISAEYLNRVLFVAPTGVVTLSDLTLKKGFADEGGVIRNEGVLNVARCLFTIGKALRGAGLFNVGSFSAVDTFFDDHHDEPPVGLGGCIHNRGQLSLDRVTLKRGQARLGCGGGIYNAATGTVDAVNTTIMRNRSRRARAGGICNDGGVVRCTNCTIARNQANNTAGGILNQNGGVVELRNTLLAGNWHGHYGRGANCGGGDPITSLGNNLEDGDTCSFTAPGDGTLVELKIRGLHQYEGFSPVGAIGFDSPAVDTGNNGSCPDVDARGLPRPSGLACDVGSFEFQF